MKYDDPAAPPESVRVYYNGKPLWEEDIAVHPKRHTIEKLQILAAIGPKAPWFGESWDKYIKELYE